MARAEADPFIELPIDFGSAITGNIWRILLVRITMCLL
jgi:hypothetical protein